jgi:tetratricopeptide (TPR) repeat protein
MIRTHSICCLALLCVLSPTGRADEDIFQIGVQALKNGNERFARACFFDVTLKQPKNAEGYYRRGFAYHYLGDYKKAIEDFSESIRLDPKNAAVFKLRGDVQWLSGETNLAIKDFSEAIRLNPKFVDAYTNRAKMYSTGKNDMDRALEDLTYVIALDSMNPQAFVKRATLLMKIKRFDMAVDDLTDAIHLDPENPERFIDRGNLFLDMKNEDMAVEDFSAAIRVAPKYDRAFSKLMSVYNLNYDKAIQKFGEMIHLYPKAALAYLYRGHAYRAKKEYDKAIADYKEARRLDPLNVNIDWWIEQLEIDKGFDQLKKMYRFRFGS